MVRALGGPITPSGIYRQSSSDKHRVVVVTEADPVAAPAGEGGVASVTFKVSENGVLTTSYAVTQLAMWEEEFDASSPLDGVTPGKMAAVPGYGIELDCATLARGAISVEIDITTVAGTVTRCSEGPIIFYNGKDVDIRPCPKDVYATPTGSDVTGDGTIGNPVRTPARAIEVGKMANGDVGGLRVHLLGPGFFNWAGSYVGSASGIHTSGHWWCKIICESGAVLLSTNALTVMGNGPGSQFRVTVIYGVNYNGGMVIYVGSPDVETWYWEQGHLTISDLWFPGHRWTARYLGRSNAPFGFDGYLTKAKKIATASGILGTVSGFTNTWNLLRDCFVRDYLAVAYLWTAPLDSNHPCKIVNCVAYGQRKFREVPGTVNTFIGGAATVSVTAGGKMRIDLTADVHFSLYEQPSTSTPLSTLDGLADLIGGAPQFLVRVSGMQVPSWNGDFAVLEAGTNLSGRTYVVLDNSISSGGAVTGTGAKLDTVYAGQLYQDGVHPDMAFTWGDQSDLVITRCAWWDLDSSQGLYFSSANLTRVMVTDNYFGANDIMWSPMSGSSKTDCIIAGNTFAGDAQWGPSSPSSGCIYVDNVSIVGNVFPSSAKLVSHNHCVNAAPSGLVGSTGDWFAGEPLSGPTWDPTPDLSVMAQHPASPYRKHAAEDRWDGARSYTLGCPRTVGLRNWSFAAGAQPVVVLCPAAPPVTMTAPTGVGLAGVKVIAAPAPSIAMISPAGQGGPEPIAVGSPAAAVTLSGSTGIGYVNILVSGSPADPVALSAVSGDETVGVGAFGSPSDAITLSPSAGWGDVGAVIVIGAPSGPVRVLASSGAETVGESPPSTPVNSGGGGGRGGWLQWTSSLRLSGRRSRRRRGHL